MKIRNRMLSAIMAVVLMAGLCPGFGYANSGEAASGRGAPASKNLQAAGLSSAADSDELAGQGASTLKIVQIAAGNGFFAAVTSEGELYTWGYNSFGQLGYETESGEYNPSPRKVMDNVAQVSLGSMCSGAITTTGELYTWGSSRHYELGYETETFYSATPKKVMDDVCQASFGGGHSAAITTAGELYMWGINNSYEISCEIDDNPVTKPTKVMDNVSQASLGISSSAALTTTGELYTWGGNAYGELGYEGGLEAPKKAMDGIAQVSVGGSHSSAVTLEGELYTWGCNEDGELGTGYWGDKNSVPSKVMGNISQASMGNGFSAAITHTGELYTWGRNMYGELGTDAVANHTSTPTKIMSDVVQVALGSFAGAAITTSGDLYVWGERPYGQIDESHTPVCVFSDGVWKSGKTEGPEYAGITSTGTRFYPDYGNLYAAWNPSHEALDKTLGGTAVVSDDEFFSALPVEQLASRYGALRDFASEGTFTIPGLSQTNVWDTECDAMTPQGICTTDSFLLITAYCNGDNYLKDLSKYVHVGGNSRLRDETFARGCHSNGLVHKPVIYVLDKWSGTYLTTLVLDGAADGEHAGGIACEGGYVWVARSDGGKSGENADVTMLRIPLSTIEEKVDMGLDCVRVASSESATVACPNSGSYMKRSSFATSGNGWLWVGYFAKGKEDGWLLGYRIGENGQLSIAKICRIPIKVNGAAFFNEGGKDYLLVNQSNGRSASSNAFLYEIDFSSNLQTYTEDRAMKKFTLPPMLEEACFDNDNQRIFTIYESGASSYSCVDGESILDPYKNRCQAIVDSVCVGDAAQIVSSSATGFVQTVKNVLTIACPVDVEVFDEADEPVCRILNDVVDGSIGNGDVEATVADGVKTLRIPQGIAYRALITPTGDGVMNVTFTENDTAGNVLKETNYEAIPLSKGQSYTVQLEGEPVDEGYEQGYDEQADPITVLSPEGKVLTGDDGSLASLTNAKGVLRVDSRVYNAKTFAPKLVSLTLNGSAVPANAYRVEYRDATGASISAPTAAGSYSMAVIGVEAEGYTDEVQLPFTIEPAAITDVSLSSTSLAYTGKVRKPSVVAVKAGTTILGKSDYSLSYKSSKSKTVGSYSVTVKAKNGNFTGSKTATYEITKAKNKVSVKKASVKKTLTAKALKKGAKTVALPKITTKFGTAKWSVVKKDKKRTLTLNTKTGKVKVKKQARSGTYTLKIRATVKQTKNYKAAKSKVVTVKITVK